MYLKEGAGDDLCRFSSMGREGLEQGCALESADQIITESRIAGGNNACPRTARDRGGRPGARWRNKLVHRYKEYYG